jgi:hypothetical protein
MLVCPWPLHVVSGKCMSAQAEQYKQLHADPAWHGAAAAAAGVAAHSPAQVQLHKALEALHTGFQEL